MPDSAHKHHQWIVQVRYNIISYEILYFITFEYEIQKYHENTWKPMRNHGKSWKIMKNHENHDYQENNKNHENN